MARRDGSAIGKFAWDTASDQWRWDPGMFALHGYPVGAVTPSIGLVLDHKQPDYRTRAEGLLELSASSDQRFSNYHGIVDANGSQRTVLVVGESRVDTSGPGLPRRCSRGFMVDVTDEQSTASRRAVDLVRERAAPIQHSLGLLMGSLGLTEDQAFAILTRISSHHNVKVRDLAPRFIEAARLSAAETSRDLARILTGEAAALALERPHERPLEVVSGDDSRPRRSPD